MLHSTYRTPSDSSGYVESNHWQNYKWQTAARGRYIQTKEIRINAVSMKQLRQSFTQFVDHVGSLLRVRNRSLSY